MKFHSTFVGPAIAGLIFSIFQNVSAATDYGLLKNNLPYPLGAAVKRKLLDQEVYADTVKTHFKSVTPENAMKFGSLQPEQDVFDFREADAIVDFALANGMRVHGQTFVWTNDSTQPAWLKNYKGDMKAWEALLKKHITTVMKHFKGKVKAWDVVNEPFNSDGTLKNTLWLRNLGPDYIAKAFRYAHEADPSAKLFLNDYNTEYGGKKVAAILDTAEDLKRRGIAIHGLGYQFHLVAKIDSNLIRKSIKTAAESGLLLHLTELEVMVRSGLVSGFPFTKELSAKQADRYQVVLDAYSRIPSAQQYGITTWGVGDYDSHLNEHDQGRDHPLLFDHSYVKKEAYETLARVFRLPAQGVPMPASVTVSGTGLKFISLGAGKYQIKFSGSGKCMTADEAGSEILEGECKTTGNQAQVFTLVHEKNLKKFSFVRSGITGKCLSIEPAPAPLVLKQANCGLLPTQEWVYRTN